MKTNWSKPNTAEMGIYQRAYIDNVPEANLVLTLENHLQIAIKLFESISVEKQKHRYAHGKWSIQQLIVHLIDTERIFAYRMLCFARGDKTLFPSFEENDYASASDADERIFKDIVEEYISVRKATLSLLNSFNDKMILEIGTANNIKMSVKTVAYMLAGHELHHIQVLKEKYLI